MDEINPYNSEFGKFRGIKPLCISKKKIQRVYLNYFGRK